MKQAIIFLCLVLCVTGCHFSVQPKKPATQDGKRNECHKSVEFELIGRSPLKFRISNNTDRAITLISMFGNDSEYPFSPYCWMYEYLSGNRWVPIPIGVDNVPYSYILKSGDSVEFKDPWPGLEELDRGTPVRLRIGKLVSKPFRW